MTAAAVALSVALAALLAAAGVLLARYLAARRTCRALLAEAAPARADATPGPLATVLAASRPPPVPAGDGASLPAALAVLAARLGALAQAQRLRADWMQRLGEVISMMTEGVVICDADGEVVFRDETALSTVSTHHGHALVEAAVQRVLGRALEGVAVREEVRLYGPPPRLFMLDANALPGGAVALITDATERERVETMRRDFVSNISHELRTPVGAISLLAETIADLLADSGAGLPPGSGGGLDTVTGLADRMVAEADRMTRAIDDLAELSRVERDLNGERSVLALQDVVGAVTERLGNAAEQRGITVNLSAPAEGVLVHADRRQLASAVHNLLDNALKYSPAGVGGSVSVRVRRTEGVAEIAVVDTGVGIPQGDLPRIFERFYRVDRSRTSSSGGIGLGLAIVRHVAINHGGDVSVESLEGAGSTFTLRIPLVSAEQDAPPAPRPEPSHGEAAAPSGGGPRSRTSEARPARRRKP